MAKGIARALLIDPKERVIRTIQLETSLETIQEIVGGYIELAVSLENGDVLYVDEEGGLKPNRPFIIGAGRIGPLGFVRRGLLVGRQSSSGRIADVKTTVEALRQIVRFERRPTPATN